MCTLASPCCSTLASSRASIAGEVSTPAGPLAIVSRIAALNDTVGASKNSVKIVGENTSLYAQGYFVYDSKKSGAMTISHLRFGPNRIRSPYLIKQAHFVGCHQWEFVFNTPLLDKAADGATLLLNSPFGPDEVWERLPIETQRHIIDKKLRLFVVDAAGGLPRALPPTRAGGGDLSPDGKRLAVTATHEQEPRIRGDRKRPLFKIEMTEIHNLLLSASGPVATVRFRHHPGIKPQSHSGAMRIR